MPLWQAVVLGVVQGLTEFLPISSTAHLLVAQTLFGRTAEDLEKDPITVVIQLGTLVSAAIYFRRDIVAILKAVIRDLRAGYFITSTSVEGWLARYIIVGSIPAGVIGLLLKKQLKENFTNLTSIAIVAITLAILMYLAELWYRRQRAKHVPVKNDDAITIWDALFIGTWQAVALMPGGSRSGCTLTAALFAGLSRPAAARFSFLLMLPILFAAGAKELYDWLKQLKADPSLQAAANEQATAMAVGCLVSAVVGYAAIAWLLHFLKRYTMTVFVVYRVLFGVAILAYVYGRAG
jgi:undecaprenyl-diphosphatase